MARLADRRRILGLVGAVALVGLLGTMPARATEGAALGGYTLAARATSIQFTYASPGLLATGDVIFQASVPESLATLSSGPTGYALSSLAWPGTLFGNLPALMEQSSPPSSPEQAAFYKALAYPVRADAFYPQGPTSATSEPVPGARMAAKTLGELSQASGQLTGMMAPGLFEVGGITSNATSAVEGSVAVTRSVARLSDVNVLNGLLHFDSIVTNLESTSDGAAATSTGSTKVSGVRFAGLDATLDRRGLHLTPAEPGGSDATGIFTGQFPWGDIADGLSQITDPTSDGLRQFLAQADMGLNELAKQSGIKVRLLGTQTDTDGALGEATANGVQIELFYSGQTTPVFSELLKFVPFSDLPADPLVPGIPFNTSPQALLSLFKETHIETISLGTAATSANAAPGLPPFNPPDFTPPAAGGGGGFTPPGVLGTGTTNPGDGGSAIGAPGPSLGGSGLSGPIAPPASITPASVATAAVPGTLALVVLLAIPMLASWTRRFADRTLAAATGTAGGPACSLTDNKGTAHG